MDTYPTAQQMSSYVECLAKLNRESDRRDDLFTRTHIHYAIVEGRSIAKQVAANINNMPKRWTMDKGAVY